MSCLREEVTKADMKQQEGFQRYNLLMEDTGVTYNSVSLTNPDFVVQFATESLKLNQRPNERICILALNTKHDVIGEMEVSAGCINGTILPIPIIFQFLLLANAESFIMLHNHPSGNPKPSNQDIESAKRLDAAGKLMGIEFLDSIVVGEAMKYRSLKTMGVIG